MLLDLVDGWPQRVSSKLAEIESRRAVLRRDPSLLPGLESLLSTFDLLDIDDDIIAVASRLQPPALRSLDAIHLASALLLGSDLAGMVTFDQRLADAARQWVFGSYRKRELGRR